jgi:hypothetical protein
MTGDPHRIVPSERAAPWMAWDGQVYRWPPPPGWRADRDGRWWPPERAAASPPAPAQPPPPVRPRTTDRRKGFAALFFIVLIGAVVAVALSGPPAPAPPKRDPFEAAALRFNSAAPVATETCCEDALTLTLGQGGDVSATDALALTTVLAELGFSPSVVDRMDSTRALDGTQTAEGDLAVAFWTYHPDNGLHVIFEPRG